jgi:hypothetical protein
MAPFFCGQSVTLLICFRSFRPYFIPVYNQWAVPEKAMSNFREYVRPWKLVTLAIGITLLAVGSFYYRAPDWDIPISLVMAILAYLTAPWSLRVLVERRWRQWPLMLFFTWFTVDGCYTIYWHFRNPEALALMRAANFPASLSLYGICGMAWFYRGSLGELYSDMVKHLRGR